MGVHMPTLPDADRGMPRWGVAPDYPRDPRGRPAAHAARPQLHDSHRHKKECVFAREQPPIAYAHACLMCTPRSAPTRADLVQFGRDPRQARVLKHGVMREEAPHEQFLTSGRQSASSLVVVAFESLRLP